MKTIRVFSVLLPLLLTACGWDPGGFKAQEKWLAQKKEEQINNKRKAAETKAIREANEDKIEAQFKASHPEVPIGDMNISKFNNVQGKFGTALNNLGFVTRYPNKQTSDNVYLKVGSNDLTLRRFQIALEEYAKECRRVSAYNNTDYTNLCISNLTKALNDFSIVLKNRRIPNKTKAVALDEATFGNFIDFEHAAKLAIMHTKLCQQQGSQGYVGMLSVAAPCNGRGDVYSIVAAEKMGLL
ncbi:hypothetical protein [Pantoea agglomerans]|uniref:hypothetical protein n=1 Tax=Enterobacter agglomerans TaxID=549 RepID=UPI00320B7DEE